MQCATKIIEFFIRSLFISAVFDASLSLSLMNNIANKIHSEQLPELKIYPFQILSFKFHDYEKERTKGVREIDRKREKKIESLLLVRVKAYNYKEKKKKRETENTIPLKNSYLPIPRKEKCGPKKRGAFL